MHKRRSLNGLCAGLLWMAWASVHAADGAALGAGDVASPAWFGTARVDLGVLQSHTTLSLQSSALNGSRGVRVLGNYYFDGVGLGASGSALPSGFRASTGWQLSSQSAYLLGRPSAMSAGESPFALRRALSTSYFGLGYTSSFRRDGWGFSADLGIASPGYGVSSDPYAPAGGNPTFDDVLHSLRLSPLLQLDVNYAF